MRNKSGLLKIHKPDMNGERWYLQRFDAAPFFILFIGEQEFREEKRKMGAAFTERVIWFQNKSCDWYISQVDINRVSELLFRKSFNLKKITNKKLILALKDMEKKKQLIKINLPGNLGKDWYHQQADAALFFMQPVGEPYMLKEKRRQGMYYQHLFIFFRDKIGSWYHDIDDLAYVSGRCIKKSSEHAVSQPLMRQWQGDERAFLAFCKRLDKIDLSLLTNVQLRKLFADYMEAYGKAVSSSSIIDGFALGTDETLQKEIGGFLESKGLDKYKHKYFTALTAPTNQSFINAAEVSLLKVARLIMANKKFRRLLLDSVAGALEALDDYKTIKAALAQHVRSYFWIKNNYYSAYVLTQKDFLEEIRGVIEGGVDVRKEINRIAKMPSEHRRVKEQLIKKLRLPKHIRILLKISEDFTYWQDERKKKTFLMDHYGTEFLWEFGQRFGYTTEELKYFIYEELLSLFSQRPLVSHTEAKKRQQAILYYQRGDKYEIISGPVAEKLKVKLFDKNQTETVNDFRGLPASRGRVRGRVKILLSVSEISKVEKGEILVAVMTRPDYVPAIKKAAAIITDEGGVTCHAAIVSRELGIPCVIGTKIATKVLKDGDEVEVNANHGVVTIINKVP